MQHYSLVKVNLKLFHNRWCHKIDQSKHTSFSTADDQWLFTHWQSHIEYAAFPGNIYLHASEFD